jgi:methionyl-tRNA formyltransferase
MKNKKKPSILFIGKRNMAGAGDAYCERAEKFIKKYFREYQIIAGKWGEPYPKKIGLWKGDYIISYLSPWIIKKSILKRAKIASINFHAGPPEYPGVGCYNFAMYNNEKAYGVTCHHMNPKVDTGKIIAVKKFPLNKNDTIYSMTQKTYKHIHSLFYDIMDVIIKGKKLPEAKINWKKKPYNTHKLNKLCKITPDMDRKEIKKRIKAVTFPNKPGAYIEIAGIKFRYSNKDRLI